MSIKKQSEYEVPDLQKAVNSVINFIFRWRLLLVLIALCCLFVITYKVWNSSAAADKYKNIALVFSFGSIVIGIFYSILNYEHAQIKYKHDTSTTRLTLALNAASDWHRPSMVENLKITKQLYDQYKHLIDGNKTVEFAELLEKDEAARSALVSILNYLECISLGIEHCILDEMFMKDYFNTVFQIYMNNYGFYIVHKRATYMSPSIWVNFTNLAQKWQP